MNIKQHIPNTITALNLFIGCVGISLAFTGNLEMAALSIGIAAIFDFFDGFAARLLNVKSLIGKDLDSLADVVSFGLLPGSIVFILMKQSPNMPNFDLGQLNLAPYLGFIIPVFSAIRLAKFNNDPRQTESFIGLPTPASAIFLGSLPLILRVNSVDSLERSISQLTGNYYFLAVLTAFISFLMVSELSLISLKFKNFSWTDNKPRFILILLSVILFIVIKFTAIPVIIMIYIVISLIFQRKSVNKIK